MINHFSGNWTTQLQGKISLHIIHDNNLVVYNNMTCMHARRNWASSMNMKLKRTKWNKPIDWSSIAHLWGFIEMYVQGIHPSRSPSSALYQFLSSSLSKTWKWIAFYSFNIKTGSIKACTFACKSDLNLTFKTLPFSKESSSSCEAANMNLATASIDRSSVLLPGKI